MKKVNFSPDEINLTELEIGPDGRIYIFGASGEILELLNKIGLGSHQVVDRLECIDLAKECAETAGMIKVRACDE